MQFATRMALYVVANAWRSAVVVPVILPWPDRPDAAPTEPLIAAGQDGTAAGGATTGGAGGAVGAGMAGAAGAPPGCLIVSPCGLPGVRGVLSASSGACQSAAGGSTSPTDSPGRGAAGDGWAAG